MRVSGGDGAPRTGSLKVSVGCHEGWFGEGQISYAGPGAAARGRLALEIVRERLRLIGHEAEELRFDLIGVDSILGPDAGSGAAEAPGPREVRARVIGRCHSPEEAERIGHEVERLYLNGPASGGGRGEVGARGDRHPLLPHPRGRRAPWPHLGGGLT